ncbi:ArsR/SmtB family transcription factor [Evansella cellulosilytica]|uniref:Transcriptional regulator, ArsR family n=1 Tax=Evansella cellulosilytica (strain ATCC 21833 / DSM 2522 / FERM P-1141 / JCM 9156 / N-4) TaxID=649639 RepID=E6TU99_EVAC2|nr:metalloregulator ArsR/SmtB family transcription factor [Evansella cellulosilytica]ADU28559.1 transcriptional regulator, ArsR family [Evansella cellulosilytica DSM 2522]
MTILNKLDIEQGAKILKLLGDNTRLNIVTLLMEDECCVCELVEILQMSQPSISQHVAKLKSFNIITERRKGQWIFYKINTSAEIYPLIDSIVSHFPEQNDRIKALEEKGLRVCCN